MRTPENIVDEWAHEVVVLTEEQHRKLTAAIEARDAEHDAVHTELLEAAVAGLRSRLAAAEAALERIVALEHKSNATAATRVASGDPCPCVNQAVDVARRALSSPPAMGAREAGTCETCLDPLPPREPYNYVAVKETDGGVVTKPCPTCRPTKGGTP